MDLKCDRTEEGKKGKWEMVVKDSSDPRWVKFKGTIKRSSITEAYVPHVSYLTKDIQMVAWIIPLEMFGSNWDSVEYPDVNKKWKERG